MKIGSLFSGIGGLELGLEAALGGETIWQVEAAKYPRQVLARHWPEADRSVTDVRRAGAHNLSAVDLICGGFPCQDISAAGLQAGLNGPQSGLWWEMHRVICELRPVYVVLENVAALAQRGLSSVLGGLASLGYDAQWGVLSAESVGAPHVRRRMFIVAWREAPDAGCERLEAERNQPIAVRPKLTDPAGLPGWAAEPGIRRVAHGVPRWVDRTKALGNAVVPQVAYQVGRRLAAIIEGGAL